MKRSDFPSYPAGAPRPDAPDERLDAWLDGALDAPDADAVARLVATDVRASNGIVHVIDRVLIPRDLPSGRAASSSHH